MILPAEALLNLVQYVAHVPFFTTVQCPHSLAVLGWRRMHASTCTTGLDVLFALFSLRVSQTQSSPSSTIITRRSIKNTLGGPSLQA